jgi:two-component system, cell cycle sensor histidine kinase and response regulator CckA
MAAVLGIIRGHQGAITIDSREGIGTRVRVLLPSRSQSAREQTDDHPSSRGTILVVDDDVGIQTLVQRALCAKGFRVLTASNGAEGVGVFEQHAGQIRLILMDVTMPQMSGVDALQRIRAAGSDVPVILSSGYDVDSARIEAQDFSGFLEKPYDVTSLLNAVEAALARAEAG